VTNMSTFGEFFRVTTYVSSSASDSVRPYAPLTVNWR
jgi:hypothetical protein